ncbi:hypothetical protein P4O66_020173, partial [Electrophorus voltai]
DISAPLNHLKKKNVVWEGTEECQQVFMRLKEALQSSPVLAQPRRDLTYQVQTDAIDIGLEGVFGCSMGCGEVASFDLYNYYGALTWAFNSPRTASRLI